MLCIFICCRPHLVQRIPHTNLVFVVIKSTFETCSKTCSSSPEEIQYNGTDYPCQKVFLNDLPRRRLSGCFLEHPLVSCEMHLLYLVYCKSNTTRGTAFCKQYDIKIPVLVSYQLNVIPENVTPHPQHMNTTQNKIIYL